MKIRQFAIFAMVGLVYLISMMPVSRAGSSGNPDVPMLVPQLGAPDLVSGLAVSSDGSIIVSSDRTANDVVWVWHMQTGQLLRTMNVPWSLSSYVFIPGGTTFAHGTDGGDVEYYDASSGVLIRSIKVADSGSVDKLLLSPQGDILAAFAGKKVKLINVQTSAVTRTLDSAFSAVAATWSRDGNSIAIGSYSGEASIIDVTSGATVTTFTAGPTAVKGIVFSPDGKLLVTGNEFGGGGLNYWSAKTGVLDRTLDDLVGEDAVQSLALSQSGDTLVVSNCRETMYVEFQSRKKAKSLPAICMDDVVFTPDGRQFIGSISGRVRLYNFADGKFIRDMRPQEQPILSLVYSKNGSRIVASYDYKHAPHGEENLNTFPVARVWDSSGNLIRAITNGPFGIYTSEVPIGGNFIPIYYDKAFDAKSSKTLTTWKVVDPLSGKTVSKFKVDESSIPNTLHGVAAGASGEFLVISPSGREIYATGYDKSKVGIFDAKTGKMKRELTGYSGELHTLEFSVTKNLIAGITTSSNSQIYIWDGKGKLLRTFEAGIEGDALTFSPNGQFLLIGGEGKAEDCRIFSVDEGLETAKLPCADGHGSRSVAWSPDGRLIATEGLSSIKIWDAASSAELGSLKGFFGHASAIAFSPDGKSIAAGGEDGAIRVWSLADYSQQMMMVPVGETDFVTYLPGGDFIASDNSVKSLVLVKGIESSGMTEEYIAAHRKISARTE